MAATRRRSTWERRLREIEREKAQVREQIETVRRWVDDIPEEDRRALEPRLRPSAGRIISVAEDPSDTSPTPGSSLDFAPGPEGLDIKRVVMPRLQRTDLLRPAIGGGPATARLTEPEHDRFRSYLGTGGLKRVRENRRDQGSPRLRTLFMLLMVLTLGFILIKMIT